MSKPRILIADDEQGMRDFLAILFRKENYQVDLADCGAAALEKAAEREYDLLISDIRMPDMSGIDLLREVKAATPDLLVILITAYASTRTAVEALKLGAHDYITKPFDVEELKIVVKKALERRQLQQENAHLRRQLQTRDRTRGVIGRSAALQRVMDVVKRVADTPATILLTGERGTGKEVIARIIHELSPRRDGKFVSVNCAAIQESLLESELFGHKKGSFTGATSAHEGLFESAAGGTILLDEIGEMSPSMQAKLLRVLQERAVRPVGGSVEVEVDVRVISSTNRNLVQSVENGEFRADLFDRLNVIGIALPCIRDRREDIPLLVEHFLESISKEMGRNVKRVEPSALDALEAYDWPGNVREIENVIRRGVALEQGEVLTRQSLPESVLGGASPASSALDGDAPFDLEEHLDEVRKRLIVQALERADGKIVDAAKLLGMTFRALRYHIKKLGLRG